MPPAPPLPPPLPVPRRESDRQGASVPGWPPSAPAFTEVAEPRPAGLRPAPATAPAPLKDFSTQKSFSPGSSPSHASCFYNALPRAAPPSSALSPEVPLRGLASPCTQASPGQGLQWRPEPSGVCPQRFQWLTEAEPRPAGQLPPLNHSPP